jgi:hypothetical protein
MRSNLKMVSLLALSAVLASGCATRSADIEKREVVLVQPEKSALDEIKKISAEARDEMRLLAKYQEALALESLTKQQHEQKFYQAVYIPPGFEQEVDLNITDSAYRVADAIATIAGYRLDKEGTPVSQEIPVSIDIQGEPLNEALKELGTQTGDVISIEVFPAAKLMKLKYNTGY